MNFGSSSENKHQQATSGLTTRNKQFKHQGEECCLALRGSGIHSFLTVCGCLTIFHPRCRHATTDLNLPANFVSPITSHRALQITDTHGLTTSAQELSRTEKETQNGIGKKNLQEKAHKCLNRLADITSRVTPTCRDLT